jgi:hypothetical protein
MLKNKRFTLTAQTAVENDVIASHGAVIDPDAGTVQFMCRQVNVSACEEHRDIVRDDRAEFEDFAYEIKNAIMSLMEEPVDEPEDIAE